MTSLSVNNKKLKVKKFYDLSELTKVRLPVVWGVYAVDLIGEIAAMMLSVS